MSVIFSCAAYDKLAKWGIKIHAGIDGGTHFVLWARAAMDKQQTTIYDAYADAVRKYGRPLRVRSDFAAEHNLVEADMRRGRPNIFRPFLRGSSVHNQRIEHFWRQVWTHLIFYYKHLLTLMGRHGFLNLVNPIQRASMVAVFLPAIQQELANFVATWNVHRVRKISQNGRDLAGHIPDCLFQSWEREVG